MSPKKAAQKSSKSAVTSRKSSKGFSDEEKSAMKERAKELKTQADGEGEVLAKIAEMREADRAMARRIHAIVKESAPELTPRLWYGMPAYAKNGKMVCFFQSAQKFNTRYATLGFSDAANLDDGGVWPVYYALNELTAATEARISTLVKQAAS